MASSSPPGRNSGSYESAFLELFDQRGIPFRPISLKTFHDHIKIIRLDLADLLTLPGADEVTLYSLAPDVTLDENTAVLIEEVVQTSGHKDRLKLLEYSTATEEGLRILGQISKLATFSRSELANIKKTEPLKRHLTKRFTSTSSLSSLNPYVYQGPVTGNRFFGRDSELATLRLQTDKSFVISGMRRSGKTSLMMEFIRRLQISHQSGDLTIFVNFETCQSLTDIAYKVLSALAEQMRTATNLSGASDDLTHLANSRMWQHSSNMPRLANTIWKVVASRDTSPRIRFLFDEYDRVINLERRLDYAITRTWRDLLMRPKSHSRQGHGLSGVLQFTFAGSRKLYEEILSDKSPLYNLAARLSLPNFDLQTLSDLVARPMREIGVTVQDPANVAQMILKITGGHPATTQHLCSLLVDDPQTERTREISVSDVQRAGKNPKFLGLFKNTIEKNVSPLGRFILAQMAINSRDKVNLHFIRDIGRKYRVQFTENQVNVELEDLADSGYLRAVDFAAGHTIYRLEVPTIPALFSTTDAENLIVDMLEYGICHHV